MKNKLPVLITYKKTVDNGQELRYTLRSLENITNWNGEVYIVGDKEDWFKNIIHIPAPRQVKNRYIDVENKMMSALNSDMPDDFILLMDDVYTTEPTEVGYMHSGEIPRLTNSPHKRSLSSTAKWLSLRGFTTLNYDIHVPIIMNRKKRLEVNVLIMNRLKLNPNTPMQARSLYGNIFKVGGQYYEDQKTKNKTLKKGVFLSTQFYTCGLNELFPNPSQFEII